MQSGTAYVSGAMQVRRQAVCCVGCLFGLVRSAVVFLQAVQHAYLTCAALKAVVVWLLAACRHLAPPAAAAAQALQTSGMQSSATT